MKRAAVILDAAATPHGFDSYVQLVAPTWSTSEVRGRVGHVDRQTPGTVTLTIDTNRNWAGFRAGQYVQLTVEIDGVRHTRCYSPAHAAGAGRTIELTVKAHPDGLVSNYLVGHARPGLLVGLSQAQGQFCLPEARPARILLISGGSGITPVMSMLRTLAAEDHDQPVTFVHYCLTGRDLTYRQELAELSARPNVRVVRVFTDEPGTGDLDGFASVEQLDAIDPEWRKAETYMCGPAPLMDSVERIFAAAGISEQLHTEAFTLAQVVAEAGDVGGRLVFGRSATSVTSNGRPVLEQAEAAGLAPEHGCRMGICHSCICPLTSGAVRDLLTGDVTTGPGQEIRICVSAPVGDVEIDL
ncbi:MAG TPA: ferredoxin reductase [Acidimicrobiales bacterium]|nr:ferredoxin reductase [Acidimicrobiales bacterium]